MKDVAIYWPASSRIGSILKSGKCPSYGVPRQLRSNGLVALVDFEGRVQLLFRLKEIQRGVSVIGADGRRHSNGCLLISKRGTIRRPKRGDPRTLSLNRHAPGAFAYFDARTLERVVYSTGDEYVGDGRPLLQSQFPKRTHPFLANNIGKRLSQPERALVKAYVTWIGDETLFAHHFVPGARCYCDLFITRPWTLLEAKAYTSRRVLREAIGQLFDYQRFYSRRPSLCILLPRQPDEGMAELLRSKHIATIWKSRGGTFKDSENGKYTQLIRMV